MPIVDGKYEARISTTFKTVAAGLNEIKKKLAGSRKVRISNAPAFLVRKLMKDLKGKDVQIILGPGEKATAQIKGLGPVAISKGKIYHDHKGVEAFGASFFFADIVFNVLWTGKKLIEVSSMEFPKCVKCMKGFFEGGWHYADKKV